MAIRDILLARRTGGHVHLCHMSTRGSVELIRWGKERGINVTAEVCPHHLSLTEEAVEGYDTNAKMNPPLRTADDVAALQEAVKDGTIDVHRHRPRAAPLRREGARVRRRAQRHRRARDGARGEPHLARAIGSHRPRARSSSGCRARRRGCSSCPAGRCAAASAADVTVFDPAASWTVDPARFRSKGRNTPYAGQTLRGLVDAHRGGRPGDPPGEPAA